MHQLDVANAYLVGKHADKHADKLFRLGKPVHKGIGVDRQCECHDVHDGCTAPAVATSLLTIGCFIASKYNKMLWVSGMIVKARMDEGVSLTMYHS